MALTDEGTGTTMLVQPSGFGGNGGFMGDGNGWWIILLFILLGGWGGGLGGGFAGNDLYPWMNNSNQISGGFQNQMLNDNITGLQNSLNGITAQLSNNQMADLERSFAAQTANTAAMTGIQSQLATCCCDNRMATYQTQTVVQSEGAATRSVIQDSVQKVMDKLCQQEIDALKAQNIALQNQVNMQNLAASQTAQTAALIADNTAQTQYLVNRIAPYPVPAYTVTNPNTPAA